MPNAREQYAAKLRTAEEVAKQFKPKTHLHLGIFYGEPYGILEAISTHCKDVAPLYFSVNFGTSPSEIYNNPGHLCLTGFFGPRERPMHAARDNGFYTPLGFTEFGRLVREAEPFDYFVYRVRPMDEKGMFNFSLTASWEYNAIRWIKEKGLPTKVIFEVNSKLPYVHGIEELGGNALSIDYADVIVEHDEPILVYPNESPTATEELIAENVAALIEDKATIQLGFGSIPMAIGRIIAQRKDLGIHSEMFCDAHIDMIEAGSVTNAHKGLYDGKSVATFALGSERLHKWAGDNPEFAMLPVESVNSAPVLAKVKRMTCINSVLTVDMTGQTCAHCIGPRTYSGMGGAFEFAFGAQLSEGGQSISCLPSTTTLKDGTVVSNIVAQHPLGTRITIPEHTVDWVVTEFGSVRLKCLNLEQRGAALAQIAHPDFRESLEREMVEGGLRLDRLGELRKPSGRFFSPAS